jgi:hypothetical protein
MTVVSITTAKKAKIAPEEAFVKNEERFSAFDKIIKVISARWPKKTPAHVAHLTGVSERAVQFWLAGTTRMSLEHVAALLRTDAGYEILEAVMGDSSAEWWIVTRSAQSVRKSRKAIKKEQERIAATRAQLDLLDE